MPVPFHYHPPAVKIVDRYVMRELLVPFLLGIAIFTSILLIVRILKLVEMVVNRGVPFLQILRLFSYILPAFLEVTVPMALLLAILVAFGRLSSDSEIIALRASGVSFYRLIVPGRPCSRSAIALLDAGPVSSTRGPGATACCAPVCTRSSRPAPAPASSPRCSTTTSPGWSSTSTVSSHRATRCYGILISDTREEHGDRQNTVYARTGSLQLEEGSQTLTLTLTDGGSFSRSRDKPGYRGHDVRIATTSPWIWRWRCARSTADRRTRAR